MGLYIMRPMNAAADSSSARSGPRAQSFQAPYGDLAVLPGSGNPILAQAIADAKKAHPNKRIRLRVP